MGQSAIMYNYILSLLKLNLTFRQTCYIQYKCDIVLHLLETLLMLVDLNIQTHYVIVNITHTNFYTTSWKG